MCLATWIVCNRYQLQSAHMQMRRSLSSSGIWVSLCSFWAVCERYNVAGVGVFIYIQVYCSQGSCVGVTVGAQSLQPFSFRQTTLALRPNFPATPQFYYPEYKEGRLLPLPTFKLDPTRLDKNRLRCQVLRKTAKRKQSTRSQTAPKKREKNFTCTFCRLHSPLNHLPFTR